jgi:hypothetical protein
MACTLVSQIDYTPSDRTMRGITIASVQFKRVVPTVPQRRTGIASVDKTTV